MTSERLAPSGGHLRRSGGQSAQGAHQARQRFPECGPTPLVRRLAHVAQMIAGIPIVAGGGRAAIVEDAVAGPGLLQDAAAMLRTVAIDASPGGDAAAAAAAATAAAAAVPMLLVVPFLVEMLLQLHVAQTPVHYPDQVLMHPLIILLHRRRQWTLASNDNAGDWWCRR